MAKDINLTSQQWNDIIFEGKNKDYGAYQLRRSSSKRHLTALLSILVLATFVAVLPALANQVSILIKTENPDETFEFKRVEVDIPNPKEDILKEIAKEEPLLLKATIAFPPPELVEHSELNESNRLESQSTLASSTAQISFVAQEGVLNDPNALAPEDLVRHRVIADDPPVEAYEIDVFPKFPGGDGELEKYLTASVIYPRAAREVGIQGTVVVRFVVNKNGAVSDVTIKKNPSNILSNEAARVVKAMPKWIPGKQNGKAVSVYFELPINFQLD